MMLKKQFSSFLIASMCFLSVSAIKGEEKVFKISTGGIKDKNDKTHVLLGPPMGEVGFPHPRRISPQLSQTEKWLLGDNPEFNAGGKLIDYGPVTFGRICNGVTTHKEFVEHTFSVYRTDEIDTKLSAVGTQITNLGTSITNASAEAKKNKHGTEGANRNDSERFWQSCGCDQCVSSEVTRAISKAGN